MLRPGESIEHFSVTHSLGRGGMGEVYAARDTRLGRSVALKVIHRNRTQSPDWKARFLREARILSSLDHPHICRVFEYLEREESDLLVLELIKGQSLGSLCRDNKLKLKQAFAIAKQVSSALATAHERGIVHRDMKPDNIMVSDRGSVKVLDFGISRTSEQEPEAGPNLKETGPAYCESMTITGQMMGTPAYMSPEQANGDFLTTASDIFSLGLIFHELFTGERAWKSEDNLADLVEKRQRGEVDAVLGLSADLTQLIESMKAKDTSQRPTASEALRQLELIESKPARRVRYLLRTAAIGLLSIFAFGAALLAWKLNTEVKRANREAETAHEISYFMRDIFRFASPNRNIDRAMTAKEMLDIGSKQITETLPNDPIARARLMVNIGTVYRLLGDYDRADELLRNALSIHQRDLGVQDPETADVLFQLGMTAKAKRSFLESEKYFVAYLAFCESNLAKADVRTISALSSLADLNHDLNRDETAMALVERAESIIAMVTSDERISTRFADSLCNLAMVRSYHVNYEKSIALLEHALSINKSLPQVDLVARSIYLSELARIHYELGQFDRAFELYDASTGLKEKTLGTQHIESLVEQLRIALLLKQAGRYQESMQRFKHTLQLLEDTGRLESETYTKGLMNLSTTYRALGTYDEAERILLGILANPVRMGHLGNQTHIVKGNLANIYSENGRLEDAETMYGEIWKTISDEPASVERALNRNNLAEVYRRTGRYKEALDLYQDALSETQALLGDDHYLAGEMRRGIAISLYRLNDIPAALEHADRALEIQEQSLGLRHAMTLDCRLLKMELQISQDPSLEFEDDFAQILQHLDMLGAEVVQVNQSIESLASLLSQHGHDERSKQLRQIAAKAVASL